MDWLPHLPCFLCLFFVFVSLLQIIFTLLYLHACCFSFLSNLLRISNITTSYEQVKLKNMLYHSARINCLAWSPDGRMVATGSLDTCVIIYDVDKPASNRITIKGAHLGGVYGLAFCDENSIISSGEDACVRVWRLLQQWVFFSFLLLF